MKDKSTKNSGTIQIMVPYTNSAAYVSDAEHKKFTQAVYEAYNLPADWYKFISLIQSRNAFQIEYYNTKNKIVAVKRFSKGSAIDIKQNDIDRVHEIIKQLRVQNQKKLELQQVAEKKRSLILPVLEKLTTDTISFEDIQSDKFTIRLKTGTGHDMFLQVFDDTVFAETPTIELKYKQNQKVPFRDLEKLINSHQLFTFEIMKRAGEIMAALPKEWFVNKNLIIATSLNLGSSMGKKINY